MTCKEKLIADHPEWTEDELRYMLNAECPSHYGIMDDPETTEGDRACYSTKCIDCWDREIPGTESSESSEATNDELVKRIADLEHRNKNQCDLIEKKTVELTIAHARIAELTGNLEEKDNDIKILEGKVVELDKKLTEHAERKIAEAFCSTSSSCALSEDDIRHAIALSMFNKYHALLDARFSSDEALKLTVMWKD